MVLCSIFTRTHVRIKSWDGIMCHLYANICSRKKFFAIIWCYLHHSFVPLMYTMSISISRTKISTNKSPISQYFRISNFLQTTILIPRRKKILMINKVLKLEMTSHSSFARQCQRFPHQAGWGEETFSSWAVDTLFSPDVWKGGEGRSLSTSYFLKRKNRWKFKYRLIDLILCFA